MRVPMRDYIAICLGHTTVHAMIEMHCQYVVDMRSREGFCAESFLCSSIDVVKHTCE